LNKQPHKKPYRRYRNKPKKKPANNGETSFSAKPAPEA
jgi:hypothetical protein